MMRLIAVIACVMVIRSNIEGDGNFGACGVCVWVKRVGGVDMQTPVKPS